MSKNNSLEIFAKHFGKKLDLDIVFSEGAVPSTNGKKITLPTDLDENVLLPMLGALLHETGHVRLTDFEFQIDGSPLSQCLNVLEDIRIDFDTTSKYPDSLGLYKRLVDWGIKGREELFKNEPLPIKILKTLYLKSLGFPAYDELAEKAILKLSRDYVKQAKAQTDTYGINVIAKHLRDEIFGLLDELKKPNGGASGFSQEELDKLNSQSQEFDKNTKNGIEELKSQANGSRDEWLKGREDLDKANKDLTKAKTKLSRNNNVAKKAELEGNVSKQAKAEAKADEAKSELAEAKDDLEYATAEDKELYDKYQNEDREARTAENENTSAKVAKNANREGLAQYQKDELDNKIKNNSFSQSRGTELAGFKALEKVSKDIEKFTIKKSLEAVLRDFFLRRKEEAQITEEGSRLANNKLSGLFSGKKDIFKEYTNTDDTSLVAFLVDNSGSMGSVSKKWAKSYKCINALTTFTGALDKVVKSEDLPLSFGVFGFDYHTYTYKKFSEPYNEKKIIELYKGNGGDTKLYKSVLEVYKLMNKENENAKKTIVILTDGCVGHDELQLLRNKLPFDLEPIFIGIDVQVGYGNELVKELFKNNITDLKKVLPVLTDVLLEKIR